MLMAVDPISISGSPLRPKPILGLYYMSTAWPLHTNICCETTYYDPVFISSKTKATSVFVS